LKDDRIEVGVVTGVVALSGVSSVHGGWNGAIIIGLAEIAILRNAVGPRIKFLDQAEMLGQMQGSPNVEHIGNPVRAGNASSVEGAGVRARDQTREIFLQGRAHVGGTVGKRNE
jgi:hypothetical protein